MGSMKKIFFEKLGFAALIAIAIMGVGWSLTTRKGSEFLANGSAMLVKSWDDVFGINKNASDAGADGNAIVPVALANSSGTSATEKKSAKKPTAKTTVAACWSTEREDLANLTALLEKSNASLAGLAAKINPASGTCGTSLQTSTAMLDTVAQSVKFPSSSIMSDPLQIASGEVELQTSDSAPQNIVPAQCPLSNAQGGPSGPIVLNEIAWMGSPQAAGETAAKASNREWIELKNVSGNTIGLNGWQVSDSAGNIKVVFGAGDSIPPGGFYLLSRDGNPVNGVTADKGYSGALSNSGDMMAVFDSNCGASDFLDASKSWPAGDNITKQTLERKSDGSGSTSPDSTRDGSVPSINSGQVTVRWQTSASPGGTPKAENSDGLANYMVSVAIQGDGLGMVVSKSVGISCNSVALTSGGSNCSAEFAQGTVLTLTATPGKNAAFAGWSGGCSGSSKCTFTVGGMVSVGATFKSGLNDAQSELLADANSTDLNSTAPVLSVASDTVSSSDAVAVLPSPTLAHLLIAQIQIAGVSSANDFVKIYNPTASAVDLGGWKLRKKSSTGSDYSLREFPKETSIGAGSYFVWANSSGGFAQSIGADASSSETLSADNSVALFDTSGVLVDAVAWGKGTGQYVEGSPYPTNPVASQVLGRKSAGGSPVDTDNNAEDFILN
jgi:hypothetical protein